MTKSPDAFRTISEVAEWLDRPAHVLRFWESKFTQVKPIKRAGGRRYYRPQDMLLLGGIKKLLHDDGMTIKGVQKLLREEGVKYVACLSQPLDVTAAPDELVPSPDKVAELAAKAPPVESATLLQFPQTEDAAEEELSQTTYEDTVEEYVPADIEPSPQPEPEPQKAGNTPAKDDENFTTPSFFSMFGDLEPDTPAPVADPEPEPVVEPEEEKAAEAQDVPASFEVEKPRETNFFQAKAAPAPAIDISVDAASDKGPGVLSRLANKASALSNTRPEALSEIRDQLRALHKRMQAG